MVQTYGNFLEVQCITYDECSNAVLYANGEKGPGLYIVPFNDLEADSMLYIAGSLGEFLVDGVGLDVFNGVV